MKKRNLTERDKEILSRVKREMERPRQTESVRIALGAMSAPAAFVLTSRSARA
jgi:hypothetical protein